MVGAERRRVHFQTQSAGVGVSLNVTGTVDESTAVNIHGLRFGFVCEPEAADANAHGTWAIWCLPRVTTAVPTTSTAALEAEGDNPVMWACGVWMAANQTPFTIAEQIKTSRNCPADTRVVLTIQREGVTAGNVRIVGFLTWFNRSL